MLAAKAEVAAGGRMLLPRAGEGNSPRLTLRDAASVLHRDDQTRHIWNWLASEQRAPGPFSPRPLAAALTAANIRGLQTWPPVFTVHVRTARKR